MLLRSRGPMLVRADTLAHSELSLTEVEHRRACRAKVEAPLLHLDQMNDHPRRQGMPLETERRESRHELVVREIGEVHTTSLAPCFSSL